MNEYIARILELDECTRTKAIENDMNIFDDMEAKAKFLCKLLNELENCFYDGEAYDYITELFNDWDTVSIFYKELYYSDNNE